MKKSLLTFLVLLISISSFGQVWLNTGNALQRQTNGTYSNYRFNLGSPGFMFFYSKTQTDSLFNIAVGSGVTSFNTRTGAVTLLSGDVTTALGFTPVPTTRQIINGYGVLGGGTLATDRTLTVDTTVIVSKLNLASQMALKENTVNKTNTISSSTTLYPSVKAVQDYVTGSYAPTTETVLKIADTTALKAYSGNSNTLQVLEQNTSGVFSYVVSATVDGGTVFPATGKGSGYWQRINATKTNNLLWFGVKGDGSDETGLIQKAINASIYKTLYAPKGVYSVKYLTGVNGITIDGGNVATFKLYAPGRTLNTFMLSFTNCHDWIVKNILVDGNLANLPGTDISGYFIFNVTGNSPTTKSYNGLFEGVTIKKVGGSAISMSICEDITIRSSIIDSCALGVIAYNNTNKIKVIGNSIGNCTTGEGVSLWGNSPPFFSYSTNSIISNNYIHDNPSAGILLRYAKGFTVTGNIIENCFSGIYGFPGTNFTPSTDGTITGNQIRGGSIGVNGINGVFSNTVMSSNQIVDCNNTGIQIGSSSFVCTAVKVIGNEITRGVTEGISFANMTNSSIENNTINDNATTPALIKGIGVNTGCVNTSVFNNIIPLATTYKLLIVGTGTNIIDYNNNINITSAAVNTNIIKGTGIVNNSTTTLLNTEGTGAPSLSATVGSVYRRTDGGAGTTLYIKQSGSGGSGWVGVNDYNNLTNTSNVMTLNTGQTVTGIKTVGNAVIRVDGATGTGRGIWYTTAGISRWFLHTTSDAETGSNAGSNFSLIPRADDGTALTTVWTAYRNTSIFELNKAGQYATDVSGTYTARSWIDKGYADGRYLQLTGGTLTGALNGTTLALSGNATAAAATTANQVVIKSQLDLKLDVNNPTTTGTLTGATANFSGTITAPNYTGLASNSFRLNGYTFDSAIYSTNMEAFAAKYTGQSELRLINAAGMQTFLGLGSNAYTSTAYAPLASPTFTGTVTVPSATNTSSTAAVNQSWVNSFAAILAGTNVYSGSNTFNSSASFNGTTTVPSPSSFLTNEAASAAWVNTNFSLKSDAPIAGSFSGVGTATTTFTVTIGTTQANTTYKVNATPTSQLALGGYVTNKTTTTFDYVLPVTTGSVTFDWALFR